MTIAEDYLALVQFIDRALPLPPIQNFHIAPANLKPGQSCKFGALQLQDGTIGLTYVALDDTWEQLLKHVKPQQIIGQPVLEIARLYTAEQRWQWALGLAAINAISQFVMARSPQLSEPAREVSEALSFEATDHIGMVGYFPSLVERIRRAGIRLTVIELDPQFVQSADNFRVTADTAALATCNKIICTGTSLVNQTLDAVLQQATNSREFHLLGPTMGSLPDPLFARGVTLVGGRRVLHSAEFLHAWQSQQSWDATSARYQISSDAYRGFRSLCCLDGSTPA